MDFTTGNELSPTAKGRHAELLVQAALLANGWAVMEPIFPEPFDLAIKRVGCDKTYYVQVKMAFVRDEERYGGPYVVMHGARNRGKVYTKEEVDFFAAVWKGDVYLFKNREKSEYWVRPNHIESRWNKLEISL